MQVKNVYGITSNPPATAEEIYQEELGFFVDGQWRNLI
jgi:hypothetical protein